MFFLLSKLLDTFLSPLTWALLCFALAIPWRRSRPSRRARDLRRRRAAGALGLGILLFFSWAPVANGLCWHVEHLTTSTMRPDTVYDAVILLGGVVDDRVPAPTGFPAFNDNVERVIGVHRLLADGKARYAIISGASLDPISPDLAEAPALARQLVAWGIDPARIILEERSKNTRENALYSKKIAAEHGFGKVVIVTSAFHMPRAEECFRAVDFPVHTLMVDYRARDNVPMTELLTPRSQSLYASTAMLRELFGGIVYRARGYARTSG